MTQLNILVVALLLANLVLLMWVYFKVSKILHFARRDIAQGVETTIAQVEGLLALYAEIKPKGGLPRTRGWAASPDFLQALNEAVRDTRPAVVFECSSGVSTVMLAAALRNQGNGKVYSLEHDPQYATKTRALLSHFALDGWAEVVDAPLVQLDLPGWSGRWYDVSRLSADVAADMLVVDGPPEATATLARYPALPALRKQLSPGSLVFMDDADRADEVEIVARWKRQFADVVSCHAPRCEKGCVILKISSAAC